MNNAEGWERKTLEQIGTIFSGGTPSTDNKSYWDGDVCWITPNDLSRIRGPYIHNSGRKITVRGLENSAAVIVPANNIVLSSRAPIGYLAIPTVPFSTNQGCKSIKLNSDQDVNFHYYNLSFHVDKIKEKGEGTTFAEISKTALSTIKFPVPTSKVVQSKIAQVLATLDRAIAQTDVLLAKQHRVKAGLMQEFLGIESAGHSSRISMSLASIAEINPARGSLPSVDKASFITMADVSESARWLNRQTRRITEVKSGYTFFREGDILLAKITPCLENGKGCHAIGLENRIGFGSTEFHVIRARDNADARFIFQLTKFNHFRQQAATKMTGSAGQQRVPAQFLENYPVRELNKNEQVKIGYVLDAADNAMEVTGNQIAKLQSLKAGLMQDLLTGRVSVLPLMGDSV